MGTKQEEASGKQKASTLPFLQEWHTQASGWDPRATCQDSAASGLAHSLFPDVGYIPFPEYQIKVSPLWGKKRFHGLNSRSLLCLWHSAVSFPACSLRGHDVPSLLIVACQLWCHAHPAQSHHSASLGRVQEAKGPLSFPQTFTDLPPLMRAS